MIYYERFGSILKIFGKMRNAYVMTPQFVASTLIMTITVGIASLIGFTLYENGEYIEPRSLVLKEALEKYMVGSDSPDFAFLVQDVEEVLFVRAGEEILYRNIDQKTFSERYMEDDYYRETIGNYQFYFDVKDVRKIRALIHIMIFTIIVLTVVLIATLFRRLLNKHVTSVLNVMIKGFTIENYSTPVRIKRGKEQYETYQLANQYNKKWLAIKKKILEIKRRKQ